MAAETDAFLQLNDAELAALSRYLVDRIEADKRGYEVMASQHSLDSVKGDVATVSALPVRSI